MTPTKLLIGQILMVLAIMLLGVWAATQWAAAMLAYQPQLGAPWFLIGDLPVYRPWALFPWWYHYEAYAPEVFDRAGTLAATSGFMGCAAAIAGSLWRARQSRFVTTYGSARWATEKEIARAGLFGETGLFLGRLGGSYLRHSGAEHVMLFAPTRSGKGVGLVIPTLLSWTGSAVIHDIKGENWQLTAGWRSRFSHCLLFDPTSPLSARYNPLLEVRRGEQEIRDVQNIADILVDPEGDGLLSMSIELPRSNAISIGNSSFPSWGSWISRAKMGASSSATPSLRRTMTLRRCRRTWASVPQRKSLPCGADRSACSTNMEAATTPRTCARFLKRRVISARMHRACGTLRRSEARH